MGVYLSNSMSTFAGMTYEEFVHIAVEGIR